MSDSLKIGPKLLKLRAGKNLSLREVARRAGVSPSHLSLIEKGHISPTVSTLKRVSDALGVTVLDLFEAGRRSKTPVIRKGSWSSVRTDGSGITFFLLRDQRRKTALEPFYMVLGVNAQSGKQAHNHPGAEFLYVLKGRLELVVGRERFILREQDSICFDSGLPHRYRNLARTVTEILSVVTPPVF